jgi:hypothetical protein
VLRPHRRDTDPGQNGFWYVAKMSVLLPSEFLTKGWARCRCGRLMPKPAEIRDLEIVPPQPLFHSGWCKAHFNMPPKGARSEGPRGSRFGGPDLRLVVVGPGRL